MAAGCDLDHGTMILELRNKGFGEGQCPRCGLLLVAREERTVRVRIQHEGVIEQHVNVPESLWRSALEDETGDVMNEDIIEKYFPCPDNLKLHDTCVDRICERCGAERRNDQSCGCFDNGGE